MPNARCKISSFSFMSSREKASTGSDVDGVPRRPTPSPKWLRVLRAIGITIVWSDSRAAYSVGSGSSLRRSSDSGITHSGDFDLRSLGLSRFYSSSNDPVGLQSCVSRAFVVCSHGGSP